MKGWGNLSFRYLKGPLIKIFRVDNNNYCFLVNISSGNTVLPYYPSLTAFQGYRKGMQCS